MGFYIPKVLQSKNNWVLWRMEPDKNGKQKKVPYNAKNGQRASTADRSTWASYAECRAMEDPGGYDGVGYVFDGSGLIFIDIDNCIDKAGNISEYAEKIISSLPETYIEYSQSGRGLHIVCFGNIDKGYRRDDVEIYSTGRYMAFTGDVLTAAEPAAADAEITEIIKKTMKPGEEARERKKEGNEGKLFRIDDEIIRRAEAGGNREVFKILFYDGDWKRIYKSQSEADMRLTSIIFFYSRDREQTKRIFRASALGKREKAKRNDYLEGLIDAVQPNMPEEGHCYQRRAKSRRQKKIIRRLWE